MNYLFFDIECANCDGGNGKICSFGYVLTDESFRVTEYRDLIINTQSKFKLRGYGNKSFIQLAYPEQTFLSSPPFVYYYEKIKALLGMEDTVIFGYAPENDAAFLRSEFERFSLPGIDFKFHDVQRLYKTVSGDDGQNLCSLSTACENLKIDTAFITHKSCDDAFATMLVMKEITKLTGKDPITLIAENQRICGQLKGGEITANYFKPKPELKPGEENMMKGVNRDNFRYLLRRLAFRKTRVNVCFSWVYENKSYREMVVIASELSKRGYRYTGKLSEADIFVKKPHYMRGICRKEKDILAAKNSNYEENPACIKRKLRVMKFADMLAVLGISEEKLKKYAEGADKYIGDLKNGTISD